MTKLTVGSKVVWSEPKANVEGHNYCVQCGKKTGKNSFWVHLSIYGEVLAPEVESQESQGYWAVGSECAKAFESKVLVK